MPGQEPDRGALEAMRAAERAEVARDQRRDSGQLGLEAIA
jgi:hypothetical protein